MCKKRKIRYYRKKVREYYGLSDDIDKLPTWNTNYKYTNDKYTNNKYKKSLLQVQLQYVQTQAKS